MKQKDREFNAQTLISNINMTLLISFLPLLRTNFYISKPENVSNYLLRYYGGSKSLYNGHELSANTSESPWTDSPLQVTKAGFMVTFYGN